MPLADKPCAYCGSTEYHRIKGHVIARCMYPSGTPPGVQRRTVPECDECKQKWEDAEAQFRNVIAISGRPNAQVVELWNGSIRPSFDKPDGLRRARDVYRRMIPDNTGAEPQHWVYPDRDPQVILIVRRIVRGLCHWHNIGTAIADERVFASVVRYEIPEQFRGGFQRHSLGDQFCWYAFSDLRGTDPFAHSAWQIEFYGRTRFLAAVSASEDGWPDEAS